MADGGLCCEDGKKKAAAELNEKKKLLINSKSDELIINNNSDNNKALVYIDSDSGKLCSFQFSNKSSNSVADNNTTNSVNTKSLILVPKVAGFENRVKAVKSSSVMASPNSKVHSHDDRSSNKKRCVDRYDSSESSDSGVAQLSCTDCSSVSCSGSSSSTSELTDPGSPYSTSSSHGEDSNISLPKLKDNLTKNDMPPHESTNHSTSPPPNSTPSPTKQPWPWDKLKSSASSTAKKNDADPKRGESPPNLLKRVTATKSTHINSKRLKTTENRKLGKSVCPILPKPQGSFQNVLLNSPTLPTSNANPPVQRNSKMSTGLVTKPRVDETTGVQQGKITEYFKSQVKPTTIKNSRKSYIGMLTTTKTTTPIEKHFYNKNGIINCDKSANLVNKIDVRTLTFQNQFHNKTIKLDAKLNGKVNPVVTLTRKILPKTLTVDVKTALPTCFTTKVPPIIIASDLKSVSKSESVSNNGGDKCSDTNSTSALSISINPINSLVLPSLVCSDSTNSECQKSPILSQPKVIRFPPRQIQQQPQDERLDGKCLWDDCFSKFETSGALLEHLQISHVVSQATKEHFVCLWDGCKVHGRKSCSRSWLERHVLSHAGNKPYRCIVDGCGCRFNSNTALERHVNSHFNADGAPNNNSQRRSFENGGSNKKWKNGKKIRYRLQPWSARMFDFFDAGIMEGLQHRLVNMTDLRTNGQIAKTPGNMIALRSKVIARRTEPNGTKSLLLRWYPQNIIADEWTSETEATTTKTVPIPGLEPSAIDELHTLLMSRNNLALRSRDLSTSSSSSSASISSATSTMSSMTPSSDSCGSLDSADSLISSNGEQQQQEQEQQLDNVVKRHKNRRKRVTSAHKYPVSLIT